MGAARCSTRKVGSMTNDCLCGHPLSAHERPDTVGVPPYCHAKCDCMHYWKNTPCTECDRDITTCEHGYAKYVQEKIAGGLD